MLFPSSLKTLITGVEDVPSIVRKIAITNVPVKSPSTKKLFAALFERSDDPSSIVVFQCWENQGLENLIFFL